MSNSVSAPGSVPRTVDTNPGSTERQDGEADHEAMLSLVSDEYARSILDALGEQPLSARELVERLEASRATVYRRLDTLESAGVVESSMSIHPDGHHRKEFRITVEQVRLTFGSDGITVELGAGH
jgi:DNA-binding transcriptional ArsR family regulator